MAKRISPTLLLMGIMKLLRCFFDAAHQAATAGLTKIQYMDFLLATLKWH
jgi:hypothetical protein